MTIVIDATTWSVTYNHSVDPSGTPLGSQYFKNAGLGFFSVFLRSVFLCSVFLRSVFLRSVFLRWAA
jgi:hypothetical protein